jgi:hypothetical protein
MPPFLPFGIGTKALNPTSTISITLTIFKLYDSFLAPITLAVSFSSFSSMQA